MKHKIFSGGNLKTSEDATKLFEELLWTYDVKELAEGVGVNVGTAKRWIENRNVPRQYFIELCRFAKIEVDYSTLDDVDKDQFFTSPETASQCYEKLKEKLKELGENPEDYCYIEPSVGDGSFGKLLPEGSIFLDVEARFPNTIEKDYLTWMPMKGRYVVVGNPPFGFRGNLALKFINHSAQFADYVAFIVPQTFESDGKGSCKSRVKGLNLILSEVIDTEYYYPNGKKTSVSCVFQIWSKHHKRKEDKVQLNHLVSILSVSDGGTPATTRNKRYHDVCDYFIVSSTFGKSKLKLKKTFGELERGGYGFLIHDDRVKEVIESIDWGEVAFVSTNGAVNLRVDLIERAVWNKLPIELKQNPLESLLS